MCDRPRGKGLEREAAPTRVHARKASPDHEVMYARYDYQTGGMGPTLIL